MAQMQKREIKMCLLRVRRVPKCERALRGGVIAIIDKRSQGRPNTRGQRGCITIQSIAHLGC